jgi:putative protein-disulfide isomerase
MSPFPKVIYVYDALCGWCYGFKSNILKLHDEYSSKVEFEILSGNMVPLENRHHISKMAGYIAGAYKRVEETTGCEFGEGYLQHILHPEMSELHLSSEKPGIALSVLKQVQPQNAFKFATALQNAMLRDGKDLEKDEVYEELATEFQVDPSSFIASLGTEEARDLAHSEFALVKQLGITGFPCVLVQIDERKLYMIARGYASYDDLKTRLEKVLLDYRIANN